MSSTLTIEPDKSDPIKSYKDKLIIVNDPELNSLQEKMDEAVRNIARNHRQIIDDWCKAYLSQLYEEGIKIKPGCFTLYEEDVRDPGFIGKKYYFKRTIHEEDGEEKDR